MKCPKCKSEMEDGVSFAANNVAGGLFIVWGKFLRKSLLWGNNIENTKKVVTYRCKQCGYLESYAK